MINQSTFRRPTDELNSEGKQQKKNLPAECIQLRVQELVRQNQ